jgi:hypothetical protein
LVTDQKAYHYSLAPHPAKPYTDQSSCPITNASTMSIYEVEHKKTTPRKETVLVAECIFKNFNG